MPRGLLFLRWMNSQTSSASLRNPAWLPRNSDDWAMVFFLLFLATIPLSKAISSLSEGAAYTAWFVGQFNPIHRHERWRRLKERKWLLIWGVLALWMLTSFFWTEQPGEMLSEINLQHSLLTLPLLAVQLPFRIGHFKLALGGFILGNLIVLGVSLTLAFQGVVDDQMQLTPSPDGKPVLLVNGSAPYGPTIKTIPGTSRISVAVPVMGGGDTLSISAMQEHPHLHLTSQPIISSDKWQWLKAAFTLPDSLTQRTWSFYLTGRNFQSNNYSGALEIRNERGEVRRGYGFQAFRLTSPFEQRPRASLFFAFSLLASLLLVFDSGFRVAGIPSWILALVAALMLIGLVLMGGRIGQVGALLGGIVWVGLRWKQQASDRLSRWIFPGILAVLLLSTQHPAVKERYQEAWKELHQGQQMLHPNDLRHSSIGLRMAYYRIFGRVVAHHPVLGVGMGDLKAEAIQVFHQELPGLEFQRPHNQFLEIQLLYGIPGSLLFLICLVTMLIKCPPAMRLPMYLHSILVVLSMLTDSTLATQAGVSYVLGFYCLIFCIAFNKSEEKTVTSSSVFE